MIELKTLFMASLVELYAPATTSLLRPNAVRFCPEALAPASMAANKSRISFSLILRSANMRLRLWNLR